MCENRFHASFLPSNKPAFLLFVGHDFHAKCCPAAPPPHTHPSLSLSLSRLSFLMDGQIMYIQSSSAPDAVKRCDKSPGGGTERSGAKEWGDEEDTTSGEQGGKEKTENIMQQQRKREPGREKESAERDRERWLFSCL